MTEITLSAIQADRVATVWPDLKPLFYRAVQRVQNGRNIEDIRIKAETGKVILWTISDHIRLLGALATGIREEGNETVFCFIECGGYDMYRWLDKVLNEIGDKFARAQGATRVEIEGRPGWDRKMRDRGYELVRVTLQKALT